MAGNIGRSSRSYKEYRSWRRRRSQEGVWRRMGEWAHRRIGDAVIAQIGPVGRRSRGGRDGFNIFGDIAPDLSRCGVWCASPLIRWEIASASRDSLVDSNATHTAQIRRGINLPEWRAGACRDFRPTRPNRRFAAAPIRLPLPAKRSKCLAQFGCSQTNFASGLHVNQTGIMADK